ncbi:hypothetical protein QTP88_011630 [Uroleucon formosanum]
MNSIQIEELERYLEEIPDNGNLVSEFEDSYLDEFDIIHPLDRVENIEEFYIQNLDVVFDDKKPTSDGNSNKDIESLSDEEYVPKKTKNKGRKKATKKSKKLVTKPKSKNTVRTLEDVEAEKEDQTNNL